jgi:hypothetical protein
LRDLAFEKQQGKCHWCGTAMVPAGPDEGGRKHKQNGCTADHVVAYVWGGRATEGNIVAACLACNEKRGEETQEDFEAVKEARRRRRIRALDFPYAYLEALSQGTD